MDNNTPNEKGEPIHRQELLSQLAEVEKNLVDLKARWPFHSVQPKMVVEREELEEERERLRLLLKIK